MLHFHLDFRLNQGYSSFIEDRFVASQRQLNGLVMDRM